MYSLPKIQTKQVDLEGYSVTTLNAYSEEGLRKLQDSINSVLIDLGATGAVIQDYAGNLLVESGSHSNLDLGGFLALSGNAMTASNAVMALFKDSSAFDMHVHEGNTLFTEALDDLDGKMPSNNSTSRRAAKPTQSNPPPTANTQNPKSNQTVSFDEARRMGLINFDPDSKT